MASFYFAVMPGGSWTNTPVYNAKLLASNVKDMLFISSNSIAEHRTIVSLKDFRSISEVVLYPQKLFLCVSSRNLVESSCGKYRCLCVKLYIAIDAPLACLLW